MPCIGTYRYECYLAIILVFTRTAFIAISLERERERERGWRGGSQRGWGVGSQMRLQKTVERLEGRISFSDDSASAYLYVAVVVVVASFTIPITATAVILATILHSKQILRSGDR